LRNKALIYLAAIILFSQAAFALETVFDAWLYSGQSITAEGKTFIIYEGDSNKEIIADYGEGSLFIKNNSCQQTGNVMICLDNTEYYYDLRTDRIKVRAISLAPDVSITRTASDTELETKDESIITVTITNTGGLAQELVYTDVFPEGIELERIDGIGEPEGNTALWEKRTLKEGKSETFSYKIIVKDVIDRSFAAKLSYFDGSKTKTLRTSPINIKSTPRLLHELILGFDESLLGEKNNITLNFTSKELLDSEIEAEIIADPEIRFTKIPKGVTKISDSHYKINTEMKKFPENRSLNVTKHFNFEFTGTKIGTFYIDALVKYSTRDFKDRKLSDLKKSVKFSQKGVNLKTNLDDFELEANQAKTLRMWLQNLNPEIPIKNVLVKLDGGGLLELEDAYITELPAHAHKKIAEKDFYAAESASGQGYTIKADISYDTDFERNFTSSFLFTETVSKIDNLAVSQRVGSLTLRSGEETTVTVSVKNPRKTKIRDILVEDALSGNFTISGTTRGKLTLDSNDEQTAYTYVIKAPRLKKETIYLLNTTIAYSDEKASDKYNSTKTYEISASSEITVKPQEFDLTASRTVEEPIFLGDYFDVEYTLKNPSTDTRAENVELLLPLQPEFDLVGDKRGISAGSLEPGEEITIANKEKRRAKKKDAHSLEKTKVSYKNDFGEDFEINVSATSINVDDKPSTEATFVFVTKSVKENANNTDFFEVTVSATSAGKSIAQVEIEDWDIRREISMLNGSTYSFTYLKRIETPGKHSIGAATASYEVDGDKFLTASNDPEILISDNPVLSIQKTAPETANAFENFDVELKVAKLSDGATNITIYDESEIHYDALTEDVFHNYAKSFKKEGTQTLAAARLTYNYKGELYEVKSNSPAISIIENELLKINKTVSASKAVENEKIEFILKLNSHAKDEIELMLTDEGETWQITLAPGEEKTIRHEVGAKQPEAAKAVYTYNNEEKEITSNVPEFFLIEPENGKVIKEKNLVKSILNLLTDILTWKRS